MASRRNAGKKPFGRAKGSGEHYPEMNWIRRWLSVNLRAEAVIHLNEIEGEVDPRLYGLSVPGLDPASQEAALIKALNPSLLRAELDDEPPTADHKLASFLNFCEVCGAEAYLVLDVQAMSPQTAADWVAYCQAPAGHPEPYPVGLWGLSAGSDFIDADAYIRQVRPYITALRAVDPDIQLALTGKLGWPGSLEEAERWNRLVVEELGDQVEVVAVQVVHPGVTENETPSDPKQLYHSLLSAPHGVEEAIQALSDLIREVVPDREIGIALDGFSLDLPGVPSLRDGLYVAGMLNAFHRQAGHLKIAALAQPENALPLTVQPEGQTAFPTPLYFPYQLYSKMEPQVLASAHWSPVFQAEALGDAIRARNQVPYIDLTATRSADGRRVVLAVTNRNPQRKAQVMVTLKDEKKPKFQAVEAWLMSGSDPLAVNTANTPEKVGVKGIKPPKVRYSWLDLELPPASLMLVVLAERD